MLSRVRPALLTRMSSGPSAVSAAASAASTCSASSDVAADAGGAVAQLRRPRPAPGRVAADDRHLGAGAVEARARCASPMPRVLPVTNATLPVRSMDVGINGWLLRGTSPPRRPSQRHRPWRPGTIRFSRPDSTLPGPDLDEPRVRRQLRRGAACRPPSAPAR